VSSEGIEFFVCFLLEYSKVFYFRRVSWIGIKRRRRIGTGRRRSGGSVIQFDSKRGIRLILREIKGKAEREVNGLVSRKVFHSEVPPRLHA
jgi:hypothetical protein